MVNSSTPSPRIDAAICDLINRVSGFSDTHFDSWYCSLTEEEVEELVVRLIENVTEELNGEKLAYFLFKIRQNKGE